MNTAPIRFAIETAKDVMKKTTISRSDANHIYTSLSHVLKEIKSDRLWNAGFNAAFDAVGIRRDLLTPALFRNIAGESFTVNKAKVQLGLWGYTCLKDADGNPVLKNGEKVMTPVFRVVHSWTPNLVLKILAQSAAFKQAKKRILEIGAEQTIEKGLDVSIKDTHELGKIISFPTISHVL